ncbi:MAG TPA: hypothetical protein VLB68_12015 [Pyrinomonadaceae bacterium]|nr:hypothetical protein [Pyrinomonadaceae bacterium]
MIPSLKRTKFRLIFSGLIAFGALIVNWLVLGDSSPFHEHFLWHGALPNLWMAMNFVPVICTAIVAGDPHSGSEIVYGFVLFIQWFILGFLLSGALLALRLWR